MREEGGLAGTHAGRDCTYTGTSVLQHSFISVCRSLTYLEQELPMPLGHKQHTPSWLKQEREKHRDVVQYLVQETW